jgi:hypothetical protein
MLILLSSCDDERVSEMLILVIVMEVDMIMKLMENMLAMLDMIMNTADMD